MRRCDSEGSSCVIQTLKMTVYFGTLWMDLESIMLSKISQAVKDIPYDLTFNRNLINKTNKQAKYNQRH